MAALLDRLLQNETGFYYPVIAQPFTDKAKAELAANYRTSLVFVAEAGPLSKALKPTVKPATLTESDFSLANIELVRKFVRKNFYDLYGAYFSPKEIEDVLKGFDEYRRKSGARGLVIFKNSDTAAVVLVNEYETHPGLKEPTRHVGYWGYDQAVLDIDEARYVKAKWLQLATVGLKPSEYVDCHVDEFNAKALKFAKKTGFAQRMWRFDRRLP